MSQVLGRQNKGPAFLTVALLFTILASVFVVLRVYVRIWVKPAFGWDDGMIIFAMLLAIVSTSFNVPEVIAGYGKHLLYLSLGDVIEALKWNYLATPLLLFSLAASKISICLFLLRALAQTHVRFRRSFPCGIIILLASMAIACAGYALGQCQPVRKLWNPATPGQCKDRSIFVKLAYANGALNAFGDLALALFPISFIKDLHLEFHRKVVLILLMCCGVVCGSLAIARTILTGDLIAQSDITYDSVESSLLAVIEENVSIIVACVPTLGVLFRFMNDRIPSLGAIFRSLSDKVKSLTPTHHPVEDGYLAREDQQGGDPISLGALATLPQAVLQYGCSVAASATTPYKSSHGGYGSDIELVQGIEKPTRFEV